MTSFELVNSFAQAPVMLAGFVAERPCHTVSFRQITNDKASEMWALALNPNLVTAGWVQVINGEPDVAIEHFTHAERLASEWPWR
jgi:hypothetical protein